MNLLTKRVGKCKFYRKQLSWQRQSKKQFFLSFQSTQLMTTNYLTKFPFSSKDYKCYQSKLFPKEFLYFSYINKAYKTIYQKSNLTNLRKSKQIHSKANQREIYLKVKLMRTKAYKANSRMFYSVKM